jgi:hypothetical protein
MTQQQIYECLPTPATYNQEWEIVLDNLDQLGKGRIRAQSVTNLLMLFDDRGRWKDKLTEAI